MRGTAIYLSAISRILLAILNLLYAQRLFIILFHFMSFHLFFFIIFIMYVQILVHVWLGKTELFVLAVEFRVNRKNVRKTHSMFSQIFFVTCVFYFICCSCFKVICDNDNKIRITVERLHVVRRWKVKQNNGQDEEQSQRWRINKMANGREREKVTRWSSLQYKLKQKQKWYKWAHCAVYRSMWESEFRNGKWT